MRGRHGWLAALLATVALAGLAAPAFSRLAGSSPSTVPTIQITIHYSHFSPTSLDVAAGSTVRFRITNTDPIDHEFILGDQALQDREEAGTDLVHDGSVPGMVSVPAGTTATTLYTFPRSAAASGPLSYGCHLPGHYAYGMRGAVHLTA